jgi:hypothetical protein
MSTPALRFATIVFLTSVFGLLAIWNMPHAIALRYAFAVLLLISVVISNPGWRLFFRKNWILLIFFSYLVVHLILFSTDFDQALENFQEEWGKMILFSLLGAGAGVTIPHGASRRLPLFLGLAFSVPLLIHLGLSVREGLTREAVPWNYWGIHESHGDLGYTAIQATIFLGVFFLYQARHSFEKALSVFLLSVCIASPVIAGSRGGTGFVLILMACGYLVTLAAPSNKTAAPGKPYLGPIVILSVVALVVLVIAQAVSTNDSVGDPGKWGGLVARLKMGLKGDPLVVNCEGVGVIQKILEDEGRLSAPDIARVLHSVTSNEAARVMAARAALSLCAAHPMGINQSRQAYQIALSEICTPKILLANAHNGWLDTALAIGIPGAILYFLVLLNFAWLGLGSLRKSEIVRPYAVALFLMSTVWIIRALFDSTQRDQMLEMQVFTIALLYGLIVSQKTLADPDRLSSLPAG